MGKGQSCLGLEGAESTAYPGIGVYASVSSQCSSPAHPHGWSAMQRNHTCLLPGTVRSYWSKAGPGFSFVDHRKATRRWLRSCASLSLAMDSDLVSYPCCSMTSGWGWTRVLACDPELDCHIGMAMGFWIREQRRACTTCSFTIQDTGVVIPSLGKSNDKAYVIPGNSNRTL